MGKWHLLYVQPFVVTKKLTLRLYRHLNSVHDIKTLSTLNWYITALGVSPGPSRRSDGTAVSLCFGSYLDTENAPLLTFMELKECVCQSSWWRMVVCVCVTQGSGPKAMDKFRVKAFPEKVRGRSQLRTGLRTGLTEELVWKEFQSVRRQRGNSLIAASIWPTGN